MKKSLTEIITTREQNPQKTNARKSKVEFLALSEEISEALEKGCSLTSIWETLHDEGSFSASYNTLRLYVLKYLNGQMPGYSQKESIDRRHKKQVNKPFPEKMTAPIPTFTYNPIPDPEKLL
ncbi:TraK family protein [Legionella waltersii]|uniref:Protein TraK n=1 Tax=Legionella waltersii TaxID=66969 RepID=A0A0W1A5F7_9GAMM|nr:TraK family protein [Legionella waltersii]KTD76550.1 protein TraK [Legionella waltersii]SNU94060.1 protein TraK [Legionella waltersii]